MQLVCLHNFRHYSYSMCMNYVQLFFFKGILVPNGRWSFDENLKIRPFFPIYDNMHCLISHPVSFCFSLTQLLCLSMSILFLRRIRNENIQRHINNLYDHYFSRHIEENGEKKNLSGWAFAAVFILFHIKFGTRYFNLPSEKSCRRDSQRRKKSNWIDSNSH